MAVFEDLMAGLQKSGADDVLVLGGGVIPDDDAAELGKLGVESVFGPGTGPDEVIALATEKLDARKKEQRTT